jgi:hypothetical protein
MFPMNAAINDQIPPARYITPPDPVVESPMPQVRSHRSKLIFDTMVTTRSKQLAYGDDKRAYDAEVKAANAEVEMQQVALAKAQAEKDALVRSQKTRELRETYKTQLADVASRQIRERQEELDYDAYLQRQSALADREDATKRDRQRVIAAAQRDELVRYNDALLQRKGKRIVEDIEQEKVLQRQSAELAVIKDARAAEDVRRRLEKTQIRARVAEQRARDLESESQKVQNEEEASYSAFQEARKRGVMTLKERREDMNANDHNDWVTVQKEKAARKKDGRKQPFPARKKELDVEEYNRSQRRTENSRLQTYLGRQIAERKAREQEEIDNDIELDRRMIAATQAKFDQSHQKMQALIPADSGIQMPTYTLSKSVMKFN